MDMCTWPSTLEVPGSAISRQHPAGFKRVEMMLSHLQQRILSRQHDSGRVNDHASTQLS